jgi:hypothetical protein
LNLVGLGGLVLIVLAIGAKVRGFKPGRGRWIFMGDKNLQHDFLRWGSKPVTPMSLYVFYGMLKNLAEYG